MTVDPRRDLGASGEQLAAEHLVRLGLTILDRNFRNRWGELDIVAWDGETLIFCEVKTRKSRGAHAEPLDSVHLGKRTRVRRMAAQWLVQRRDRPHAQELRFDAIGVTLDPAGRLLRLDHLEGAF